MICNIAKAQIESPIAKKNFDDGLILYNSGSYERADSMFNLSFNLEPSLDAFYYKTISKKENSKILQKCNEYLNNGNEKAWNKYYKECGVVDSVYYKEFSNSEIVYYCRLEAFFCDSLKKAGYTFCKQYTKDGSISTFFIESDSSEIKTINPIINYPDPQTISSDRIIFTSTREMPLYPGGDAARIKLLADNIKYPEEARDNGISGTVYLSFIIDEEGYVRNTKVIKGFDKSCDAEAVRIVNLMPKWIPGKDNGKSVRFIFNMPIKFTVS